MSFIQNNFIDLLRSVLREDNILPYEWVALLFVAVRRLNSYKTGLPCGNPVFIL